MAKLSAWRIVKARHAARAFDGEGARLYGGRWNSAGVPVVYLAQSRSLALLEILVHLQDSAVLASYVQIEAELDSDDLRVLDASRLPAGWRASPPPAVLQQIGDAWVASRASLGLSVPSAIVPDERLYVLDPRHPRAASLTVGEPQPVQIDPRLA